jgi:hypothetical protein
MRRMVVRSLVGCVVVLGCQSKGLAPRTDLPCTPSIHPSARRGPPLYEGYRFIAGAADGKRVAIALSHMGPGSGQPVGGAHVIEAGASEERFTRSYFDVHGSKDELPKVETGITTDYAGDLSAAGVEVGQHLPEQQAWCAAPTGAIYTANGTQLELRVSHPACEKDPTHKTVAWQLCTRDGAHCARSPAAKGCLDGEVSLHDLVRTTGTDWAVVDVATRPFPDSEFHVYEVAGAALSGS